MLESTAGKTRQLAYQTEVHKRTRKRVIKRKRNNFSSFMPTTWDKKILMVYGLVFVCIIVLSFLIPCVMLSGKAMINNNNITSVNSMIEKQQAENRVMNDSLNKLISLSNIQQKALELGMTEPAGKVVIKDNLSGYFK